MRISLIVERHLIPWHDSSAPTGCAASRTSDITAELALSLAVAAAHVLGDAGA